MSGKVAFPVEYHSRRVYPVRPHHGVVQGVVNELEGNSRLSP